MTIISSLQKRTRSLAVFLFSLLTIAGCNSEKETPNGLKFTVVKSGDKVLGKKNEVVVFDFVLKDSKDSVWTDTYKEGMPGAIPIGDSSAIPTENGMVQMFRMLSKGDSVQIKMPIGKFYKDVVGSRFLPKEVDSTLVMSFMIGVRNIMSMESYSTFQTNLQTKADLKKIDEYLLKNSITAQQDTSGMRYVIYNTTGNAKPVASNCVKVRYTGMFMENGQLFDQGEISYPLQQTIPGWILGIPLLGKGDSATFYIPSRLGYGPRGFAGAIPPNAILIFNVALIDFSNSFDAKTKTCIE